MAAWLAVLQLKSDMNKDKNLPNCLCQNLADCCDTQNMFEDVFFRILLIGPVHVQVFCSASMLMWVNVPLAAMIDDDSVTGISK